MFTFMCTERNNITTNGLILKSDYKTLCHYLMSQVMALNQRRPTISGVMNKAFPSTSKFKLPSVKSAFMGKRCDANY
jgi:hypothetical protein